MTTKIADPVVDAEVVDDEPETPAAASTAVVRRERRSEVIRPLDADALVDSFQQYQELLPRLLSDEDYQAAGRDKDGKPKRFVKKSGWRKIATAFDLDVHIVRGGVDRDEHGQPVRAEVWARAIAPSGRSMDGDGYCSIEEERFSGPRGNRSKLENDLRATATTRAMNRAISGLVGMGEVSAEEMDAGGPPPGPAANEAPPELKQTVRNVIHYLVDGDPAAGGKAVDLLARQWGGRMPEIAAQAIVLVGRAVKDQRDAAHADLPFNPDIPINLDTEEEA